jgi:energy-coupling factor transporter ATP-binding protein EcfA2
MTIKQSRPAIAATGLRKSFDDQVVLDSIDFDVAAGSIFSKLGPNGAGKTTTVNVLTTLMKADGGTVRVAGVTATVETDPPTLPRPVDAPLATVLREAVTNVLRHSRARHCDIAVTASAGQTCLRVVSAHSDRVVTQPQPTCLGSTPRSTGPCLDYWRAVGPVGGAG